MFSGESWAFDRVPGVNSAGRWEYFPEVQLYFTRKVYGRFLFTVFNTNVKTKRTPEKPFPALISSFSNLHHCFTAVDFSPCPSQLLTSLSPHPHGCLEIKCDQVLYSTNCHCANSGWLSGRKRGERDANKQACRWITQRLCQQHACHRERQFGAREKKTTDNKMIQNKLIGKIIHIWDLPHSHFLASSPEPLLFVCVCLYEHICTKSRALFWFMWCGMSGMSHRIRECWAGHCLPLRFNEGASTMYTTLPTSFNTQPPPQIPGTYQLEGLLSPRVEVWGWVCLRKTGLGRCGRIYFWRTDEGR